MTKKSKISTASQHHHLKVRGKKNHPPERWWQGAGAHLRPKRTRHDVRANNDSNDEGKSKKSNNTENCSSGQFFSK